MGIAWVLQHTHYITALFIILPLQQSIVMGPVVLQLRFQFHFYLLGYTSSSTNAALCLGQQLWVQQYFSYAFSSTSISWVIHLAATVVFCATVVKDNSSLYQQQSLTACCLVMGHKGPLVVIRSIQLAVQLLFYSLLL